MSGGAKCFLSIIFLLSYCDGFKILVIGASGRVGNEIVNQLIRDGTKKDIRILLRNPKESSKFGEFPRDGVEIFEGDILDDLSLLKATENVSVVIDVHGAKRFSKFSDIFKPTPTDLTHPYHVNYQGTLKLLKAMKTNNVKKIIRITGALVNREPLRNPLISMFNILLSRSPKWHEQSEIAIRNSGIKYTVLRPPGLKKEPPASETCRHLFLENGDNAAKSTIGKISITDVSRLCVIASCDPAQLENSTAICVSLFQAQELPLGSLSSLR